MKAKISDFEISEYLEDEDTIAAYLNAIVDEGDPKLLLSAIGDIAKARGMTQIASDSGLGRESLYKALNPDAKPRFDTILKVLKSLGVKIGFNAIDESVKNHSPKGSKRSAAKVTRRKLSLSRPGTSIRKHARQGKR